MSGHSIIPPSGAGQIVACTGCVQMQQRYPALVSDTLASMEGTASHWVGSEVLDSYKRTDGELKTPASLVGSVADNGVIITEDMADAVSVYTADVLQVCQELGALRILDVERKLHAPQIHPLSWGTCDSFLYAPAQRVIYAWEYKHGHGYVSEYDNWQSINYIAGIVNLYQIDGAQDQDIKVHIRIVQPRCYSGAGTVRESVTLLSDLRGHFNYLSQKFAEALGPNAICQSGTQCQHCTARHSCATFTKSTSAAMAYAETPTPEALDDTSLGVELDMLRHASDMIGYRLKGLTELAEVKARAGTQIYGHTMERTTSARKWTSPDAEIKSLGEGMGVPLTTDEPRTPKQAKALFKKAGLDPTILNAFSTRTAGVKFAPIDTDALKRRFTNTNNKG